MMRCPNCGTITDKDICRLDPENPVKVDLLEEDDYWRWYCLDVLRKNVHSLPRTSSPSSQRTHVPHSPVTGESKGPDPRMAPEPPAEGDSDGVTIHEADPMVLTTDGEMKPLSEKILDEQSERGTLPDGVVDPKFIEGIEPDHVFIDEATDWESQPLTPEKAMRIICSTNDEGVLDEMEKWILKNHPGDLVIPGQEDRQTWSEVLWEIHQIRMRWKGAFRYE